MYVEHVDLENIFVKRQHKFKNYVQSIASCVKQKSPILHNLLFFKIDETYSGFTLSCQKVLIKTKISSFF